MYSWFKQREISSPPPPLPKLPYRVHEGPIRHISMDSAIQCLASSNVVVSNNKRKRMLIIHLLGTTGQTLPRLVELDYVNHQGVFCVENVDFWNTQKYIHEYHHRSNMRLAWSRVHVSLQNRMATMAANNRCTLLGPFCRSTPEKDTYAYVMQRPPELAGGRTYLFSVVEVTRDQVEQFYFDAETPVWGNNEDISGEWFTERYGAQHSSSSAWSLPRRDRQGTHPWVRNVLHEYAILDSELYTIRSCILACLRGLFPATILPS